MVTTSSTNLVAAPPAMNALNPRQLARFLKIAIEHREPVLIGGMPGVGKTDIVTQAAQEARARLIVWHPVTSDPTDFKGFPHLDPASKTADFFPFEKLRVLRDADPNELIVVLMDDLAHAPNATQAAAMHLLDAREIDGVRISDNVVFIAATNRTSDMAGVNAVIEPFKSRFFTIVELVPDVASWKLWAARHGIPTKVIAYIDKKGVTSLNNFQPTKQLTNSPSPRTWAHVGKLEKMYADAEDLKWPAIHGAIGDVEAIGYHQFSDLFDVLPNVQHILDHPDTAPIPHDLDVRYATSVALANVANRKTLPAVTTYSERLVKNQMGEYAVLILRDASKRDADLLATPTWTKVITPGPLGQLFTGMAA